MFTRSLLVAIPLMLFFSAIQSAALARLTLFGQMVQPVILMAIAWAILRGLPEGITWGFAAGLALDLFSVGPVGASSLALMAAVALAAAVRAVLPNSRYLLPMLLGGVCTVVYLIFTGLLSQIAGFTINWGFLQELVLVVVVQSAAMALVYWPLVGLDHLLYPAPISTLE